jgi:hypothetical protein
VLLRSPPRRLEPQMAAYRRAAAATRHAVLDTLPASQVRPIFELDALGAFTAVVTAQGAEALLAHPAVLRIEAMRYGSGALSTSVPHIRADAVHRRGDIGQGVTVAVLDSGVQADHPDVAGRVVGEQCFCAGCCPNGSSEQSGAGSAFTTFVHGIHVTGIIASQGVVAPPGVAPGAQILAIKVLDEGNRGLLSDWIRALDWLVTQRPDVQVVNMSLASQAAYAGACDAADGYTMAFAQVIGLLRTRGTLTFAAAGNTGRIGVMAAPACVANAVAVGAESDDGGIAAFTSRSEALDLVAPGVHILSDGPGGGTAELSGTSMATPHASGTAALVLASDASLDADDVEFILKNTGKPVMDAASDLRVARIDALAAWNAAGGSTRPLPGGGSARNDCMVEWDPAARSVTTMGTRAGATCQDGDPTCDRDAVPGQCTIGLRVCFNVADPRLAACVADAPVTGWRLLSPNPAEAHDPVEAANGAALAAVLPAPPVAAGQPCTAEVPFVVSTARPSWIRFSAWASDGRTDVDRLRLRCVAAK